MNISKDFMQHLFTWSKFYTELILNLHKITLGKQIEDHSVCLPLKEKCGQVLETWKHMREGSRLHSAKMQGNGSVTELPAGNLNVYELRWFFYKITMYLHCYAHNINTL